MNCNPLCLEGGPPCPPFSDHVMAGTEARPPKRGVRSYLAFLLSAALVIGSTCNAKDGNTKSNAVLWSRMPPGGLSSKEVPQFVAITFDDNFGLASPTATGGVNYIVDLFKSRKNPAGKGRAEDFDGSPIHASFFHTSIYVVDDSKRVLGGKPGEDHEGRNRKAWSEAFHAGHEAGNHTVNHFNGGVVPLDPDDCCRARNFSARQWEEEIAACRQHLSGPEGIGAKPSDVVGFRAPYLGYNDAMLTALSNLGFVYDTSLPNCFDESEDGSNCSWPYSLDRGSPDVDVLSRKFSRKETTVRFPEVTSHPGLWEFPPTTLIVPPDDVASRYGFSAGLRARIAAKGKLPYPSIYEASTGKITGLDYTLLMDAGLTGAEMAAVLKYNLDLHINGNRAPLIFVAHSHLYTSSTPEENPDTPTAEVRDERWKGLTDFVTYALSKPETRIVRVRDIHQWITNASSKQSH